MSETKKGLLGRAALVVTTLLWGTSFVILKGALDSVTPTWVMAYRFSGATAVLLLMCFRKFKLLDKGYLKGGVIMGALLAAGYIVQTYGLDNTTPAKNAFLTATYCVIVPFLGAALKKCKLDAYNVSAAFLCIIGIGFVCLRGGAGAFSVNIGDMLTIACGFLYAAHIIATDGFVGGRDAVLLTFVQFAAAAVICFVAALLFEPIPKEIPSDAWVSIIYLSVMCTGICFLLQTVGQKHTPPAAAALILMLESVFGTLFSVIPGKETLSVGIVFGFSLIFIAILISETKLGFLKKKQDNT